LYWVILGIGSLKLFAQLWLQTTILLISASWTARIAGVSFRHLAKGIILKNKNYPIALAWKHINVLLVLANKLWHFQKDLNYEDRRVLHTSPQDFVKLLNNGNTLYWDLMLSNIFPVEEFQKGVIEEAGT
jgi:hypothetical protein